MNGQLSDRDHDLMDSFLAEMADALTTGRLSKPAFVEAMAYVITALDIDNRDEARFCFAAGFQHFQPYVPEPRGPKVKREAVSPLETPDEATPPVPASNSVIVLSDRRRGSRRASDQESGLPAEMRAPRRSR